MVKELDKYDLEATTLFRSCNTGILSTISKKYEGYPFGSFITYVSGRSKIIYLYLSDLAQHTKNLNFKTESCLTISKTTGQKDKQNSQRLTLMGDLKLVPKDDLDDCRYLYHLLLPESKQYAGFHDFNFYQLEIKHVRWIGGFGKIKWLNEEKWRNSSPKWLNQEEGIISHMNDDHSNSIVSSLNAQHRVKDKEAKMICLNTDGYYLLSGGKYYFIQFFDSCYTMKDYKNCLVNLAKKYKTYEL